MMKTGDKSGLPGRALSWGLAGGLFFAALDPAMAAVLKAGMIRDLGPTGCLELEAAALAFYVPLALVLSVPVFLIFGERGPMAAGGLCLAAAAWLPAMSMMPGQSSGGLLKIGAVLLIAAVPAGAAGWKLGGRFRDLTPAQIATAAILGFFLSVCAVNLGVVLLGASNSRMLLKTTSAGVLVFIAAALWVYLLIKGRPRLQFAAVAAAALIAVSMPMSVIPGFAPADPVDAVPPKDAPHVILIIGDAMRFDAMTPERTPNLFKLASEGIMFENARSTASWTIPAVSAMMTSRDPERLRLGLSYLIPPQVPMLAEQLNERGYQTSTVSANKVIGLETGVFRGFQELIRLDHQQNLGVLVNLPCLAFLDHYVRKFLHLSPVPDTTPKVASLGIERIEKADRPIFLFLHFMDPHDPYSPPPELMPKGYHGSIRAPFNPRDVWHVRGDFTRPQTPDLREGLLKLKPADKKFIAGLYLGEVARLDRELGRVFDAARNVKDRPVIIVFMSDHGEEFWDHGDWGHGQSMHEELLHTPLIIWRSGGKPMAVKDVVNHMAIMPTLRELLGLPADPDAMASSLVPLFQGKPWNEMPCFSSQNFFHHPLTEVRLGSRKIIHYSFDDSYVYYDLATDPKELSPTDALKLDAATDLVELLKKHEAAMDAANYHVEHNPAAEDKARRLMKAVGYIQ